jgi:hypothetical protein
MWADLGSLCMQKSALGIGLLLLTRWWVDDGGVRRVLIVPKGRRPVGVGLFQGPET